MTSEKLLDAFGMIDDELIDEADKKSTQVRHFPTKRILKWTTLAACLAIFLIVSIYNQKTPIVINNIVSEMNGSMEYFDPDTHHEEQWSKQKVVEYFGVDFFKLSMPYDMALKEYTKYKVIVNNDGKVVSDSTSFQFISNNDDNRSVIISVSKLKSPSSMQYNLDTDRKTKIGDMELVIGGKNIDDKTNIYELLVTDFVMDDTYYRVSANNITGEEFIKIIKLVQNNKK